APASLAITSTGSYTMTLGWPAGGGSRYRVDRSTDGVNWSTVRSWSDVLVSTSFQDYGLRYATTYYYAVGAYNDDGVISVSSAMTSGITLDLPSMYTAVFATDSAKNVSAPLPGPGLITVTIPAGTPDGYFWISTSAATDPGDISKNALDDANARLTDASLVPGTIVELHLFDVYGNASTATLPSAARVAITYPDADGDGVVDGSAVRAATLRLYNLDTAALLWGQQPNSTLNAGTKTVYADVPHFSFYALGGDSAAEAFKGTALSTSSIQWKWPLVSGVDGYYLYSSSTANKITLSSTTNSYTDAGLGPNKPYTRWLTSYTGAAESAASQHITRYTYAIPPDSFTLSTVTATSAYLEWRYSTATAYAVEGSTDGGSSYYRIRDAFVPWQTVTLLSNKSYRVRIGALNGDNELSPGYYSEVRTATTPPLNMTMTGVAVSSYTIEWRWDTSSVDGTGITGYNVYRATSTEAGDPPAGETGEVLQSLAASATYWIETFNAAGSKTSNSLHSRWIKAVGLLESAGRTAYKRYTYAVAPSTCALAFPDFKNVFTNSVNLSWNSSDASKYVIEYATATASQTSADFSVGLTSAIVTGPGAVTGLQGNTKHDFRIGAINGDGLQTPDNALNPQAYSARYKVLTRPPDTPVKVEAVTDTSLKWSWSTGTYTNLDYITGYVIGIASYTAELGDFVLGIDSILGTNTTSYTLDYLITNSTHTRFICSQQSNPATGYASYGGVCISSTGATFATPPNDVSFDTITAHTIGVWWNEPQVPATQYRVERSTTMGEDGPWVFLSSVTGNRYLDTGLDISASGLNTSTTYTYRIGAINQLGIQTLGLAAATNGNRRDYSFVESTMTVQIAPVLYAAAAGTDTINWSWTNSVAGVLSFNVYTSTNGILASGLSASATYWTEVGLSSANTSYTRRIRSVTSMGESDYSEASAITFALAPDSLASSATGLHTITLGWNGNGGTRYRLDRSEGGAAWTTLKSWNDALTVSTYTDTGLRAATTYYYAVFAYNADGVLSASSAASAGIFTDYLPADVTQVYSTAAVALTVSAPLPGLGTLSVTIPPGAIAADDYISLSTSAATAPVEVSSSDLTSATAKLTLGSLLNGGVAELRRWTMYGVLDTANFAVPARVTFAYNDVNGDGIVDGTAADVNTLRILLLDTATLEWVPQRNSVLDRAAKTVYLDTSHFSIYALGSVLSYAGPLDKVFAYPNPYKPGSSGLFGQPALGDGIVFESLPAASTIKIYDLAGGLVRELSDDDSDGRCFWDTRNKAGSRAASGVYFYLVKSPDGGKKSGKVVIIR
ncbi:MAG: fibronectin type III domain-containing protein, partial [Elusimicrobia bacterium]|nr:fibronectin type III domain-containing protein [Elusimicrobiota bacterium]